MSGLTRVANERRESLTADRSRQMRLLVGGVAFAALGRGAAEFPAVVEWHRASVFPWLSALLQSMSGRAAGTLGEVVAVVLVLLVVRAMLMRGIRGIGGLILAVGLVVFGFYACWGLAYRYPPLSTRLAPLETAAEGNEATARLSELATSAAGLAARASAGAIAFTGPEADFLARVNTGLGAGFAHWPSSIEASPVRNLTFGPAKISRASFALSRLQLSGYYFPWTGEAQINGEMPRTLWPRVAAHEKAHQRGFARENEATVIGLVTCLSSPEPTVFYAGALGLFVDFDREVARVDPELRRRLWAALPSRVARDLRAEAAFWKSHEGMAGAVSEKVNDTYLKAQGVRSGVGSYAETTRLLLQAVETPTLDLGRLLQGHRD